jgi:hypothetical protein
LRHAAGDRGDQRHGGLSRGPLRRLAVRSGWILSLRRWNEVDVVR